MANSLGRNSCSHGIPQDSVPLLHCQRKIAWLQKAKSEGVFPWSKLQGFLHGSGGPFSLPGIVTFEDGGIILLKKVSFDEGNHLTLFESGLLVNP